MRRAALIFSLFLLAALAYFSEAFIGRLLLAEGDGLLQYYPVLSHVVEIYKSGGVPLWTSRLFAGFPLMAASQFGVLYPLEVIPALALPVDIAYNFNIALHVALAGFFTFLYVRETGQGTLPAAFAGVVYGFTGYLVPHIQHVPILVTAAWPPLVLYFIEKLRKDMRVETAVLLSFAVALEILAGHPQVLFYSFLVMGPYVLYASSSHARRRRFISLCLLSALMGVAIGSPQLFATYELSRLGVRGGIPYEEFASFSLDPGVLPSMLLPVVFGRGEAYFSLAALLLALVAIARGFKRGSFHVRFWAAAAAVVFVLALGDTVRPLHRVMYHVPLYGLFRGSVRHLVEFNLAVAVLAAFGLSAVVERLRTRPWRIFVVSLVLAVLALEVRAMRDTDWSTTAEVEAYAPESIASLGAMNDRTAFLTKHVVPYLLIKRNVNILTGYDPMVIADLASLLEMGGVGGVPLRGDRVLRNNLVLSMFNTRFVFVDSSSEAMVERIRAGRWEDGAWGRPVPASAAEKPEYAPLYKKLHAERGLTLYENLNAMPRAFAVTEFVPAAVGRGVWAVFYSLDADPRRMAALSPDDIKELGGRDFTRGEALVTYYSHMKVALRTRFQGDGFVVLSDQFYPGWRAYLDGDETKVYKVNAVMRGVAVPRGVHEVVFKYVPVKIYALMAMSAAAAVAMAGWLVWGRVRRRRQ